MKFFIPASETLELLLYLFLALNNLWLLLLALMVISH